MRCGLGYLGHMPRSSRDFTTRYGAWAAVAGASEGLGEAFADALAARGVNLLLLARRAEALGEVARRIRSEWGVEVRPLTIDVASPNLPIALAEASTGLEIGLVVYNAAFAPIGPFFDLPEEDLFQAIDVNVRGPIVFLRSLVPPMLERGRGAVVLMSSLSGLQGSPKIATYAATKAFNTILAEGLWGELRSNGIDVVASCAGAIRTPGYSQSSAKEAPGMLDPIEVAEQTLRALGRGPRIVPGWVNKIASTLLQRILSRGAAVRLMSANTKDLS
jgi:short-subunit dehydrogenase